MKKLAITIGVLIVVVIILLVIGISNLGPLIKTAVNTYGPKITKADVSVGDVGVSVFSGQAKLQEFRLGNPEGFKSPHAVRVGAVYVDVDEGSLTGDTIIIDKIAVSAPEIIYEKSLKTDNLQAILKNLQRTASAEKSPQEESGGDSPGKKIWIKDFVLEKGRVSLATTVLKGQSISAEIPDIHLKDLGKEAGGTSPAEVFEKVLAAVRKAVISPGVSNVLKEGLRGLGEDIEAAGKDAQKRLETAGEDVEAQVKSMEEDAQKQAEETQKQLESDIDALKDQTRGLFGD